ncbi:hypothetical protein P152DRAFT_347625 [Eremomyces bilateralis CBS 781.70]|uniref:CBS domain-containing protein n=1 Tax=Eremomyces bilateralis CBS 781.70 TaxID=1392243 RepID=A0A6G1G455_9PEZI|nr:uncharacterized protein P152DRAFT_347625 [Eremomyces bilateralis CBS 781.70]KAF1812721.1 hypothetical protein P152DRAFT_347625 [Eremomyces bilateralis CBS 781.70]
MADDPTKKLASPPLPSKPASRTPSEPPASSQSPPVRPLQLLSSNTSTTIRSPPSRDVYLRTPSSPSMSQHPSPHNSHRTALADNLRGPISPRPHRTPSLTQQALQDLLNNPPVGRVPGDDTGLQMGQGRDWKTVTVGEVVDQAEVRFVDMDMTVEAATELLINSGAPNVVLLRENPNSRTAVGTFDYSDLNAYLLLVVGLAKPDEAHISSFRELARRGREGKPIPLKDVKDLGRADPLVTLSESAPLANAVELFGSGVHRIIVVKNGEQNKEVVGILTQLRLVRFFWENGKHFPMVAGLYSLTLRELNVGSKEVVAINGDKPLTDALELMHNAGITSLPVLDDQHNVIGNISHVDVRLLTKSTSLPLLRSSCIHFISVILSERGVNDGKDSYPVFHVNPYSTLAHSVAKLVATRSHRMWVVDAPSPASSGPSTPALTPSVLAPPPSGPPVIPPPLHAGSPPPNAPHSTAFSSSGSLSHTAPNPPVTPVTNQTPSTLTSAQLSALPGATLSGHLCGVISLTDILNLFARASGLSPADPNETRRWRRRSSSASLVGRRSVDSSRSDSIASSVGHIGDLSRSGSVSGRR